jgi:D-3-phosphoglycerate dehydrogenase / 2-oxoglutarate reductase
MNKKKVLITTVPFAKHDTLPLELLESGGYDYVINPLNKKLREEELLEMVSDFDVIIAGTERINSKIMDEASKLKLISRVGIGLDGVDLKAARERDIVVSYTPDAPTASVAEFTLGSMFTLLRSVHLSNIRMHNGEWQRYFGRRITATTIGIIGLGRIGTEVLKYLAGFNVSKILLNDIEIKKELVKDINIEWTTKEKIYKEADIISLHIPLTPLTKNMIKKEELLAMKNDAMIINTSRGGIVNELDLYDVMMSGHLSGAAIDVFNCEPYIGKLKEVERCLLTAHMGSMSIDCRTRMEIEATQEAVRFLSNKSLKGVVPQYEYDLQEDG